MNLENSAPAFAGRGRVGNPKFISNSTPAEWDVKDPFDNISATSETKCMRDGKKGMSGYPQETPESVGMSGAETSETLEENLFSFASGKMRLLRSIQEAYEAIEKIDQEVSNLRSEAGSIQRAIVLFEQEEAAINEVLGGQLSPTYRAEWEEQRAELENGNHVVSVEHTLVACSSRKKHEENKVRLPQATQEIVDLTDKKSQELLSRGTAIASLQSLNAEEARFREQQDSAALAVADRAVLSRLTAASTRFVEAKGMARDDTFFADIEKLAADLYRLMSAAKDDRAASTIRHLFNGLSIATKYGNISHGVKMADLYLTDRLPPVEAEKEIKRLHLARTAIITLEAMTSEETERFTAFNPEIFMGSRFDGFLGAVEHWYASIGLEPDELGTLEAAGYGKEVHRIQEVLGRLLARIDLAVMPTEVGRTLFDSSKHFGQGIMNVPGMRDGVISGIIKVGFTDKAGEKMVQQPRVLVNRS